MTCSSSEFNKLFSRNVAHKNKKSASALQITSSIVGVDGRIGEFVGERVGERDGGRVGGFVGERDGGFVGERVGGRVGVTG